MSGEFLPPKKEPASATSLRSGDPVTVLAVADPADAELRHVLSHSRWMLLEVPNIAEAVSRLEKSAEVVIICQPVLSDGTWKQLLDCTSYFLPPPPLLVASLHADDDLWMEVLNSGGYNVISKPFDLHELVRLVSLAWLDRLEKARRTIRASAG
jgi:DNA-binding NtrC family response regulator